MGLFVGKPWVRKSNGKQSTSVIVKMLPKRSHIRLVIVAVEDSEHNNTYEFLKLSTTICMSTRPWAEIKPDDAHICDFCLSCALQPMLTNHSRSPNSPPLAHHLVPGYRRTVQIAAGTSASAGSAAPCQKPCDGKTQICHQGIAVMVKICTQPQTMAKRLRRALAEKNSIIIAILSSR